MPAVPFRISNDELVIETFENSATIELRYKKERLLYFHEGHTWFGYNGEEKRVCSGEESWFDYGDNKEVKIVEDENKSVLKITWANQEKDPAMISYVFELDKATNSVSCYLSTRVDYPAKVKRVEYMVDYERDYDIYTPKGEFIENDWQTRFKILANQEIPSITEDYQLLIDPLAGLSLSFDITNIQEIGNCFDTNASAFFTYQYYQQEETVSFSPLRIAVSSGADMPPSHKLPAMKVVPIVDGKLFEVYYKNEQIATVSLGSNELVYDGINKGSFSSEKYKYAWFSDEEDSREMTIDETDESYRLSTLLSNDDKEVRAIEFSFELAKDGDYLKAQMFVDVPEFSKLGGIKYRFSIPGYDVYLPDGQVLINDNETNYMDLPLTDNFEVLYNNEAAIIITAWEITKLQNIFKHQVFDAYVKEHDNNGTFMPVYLLYVPDANVRAQDGEIFINCAGFQGTVKEYIEREIYEKEPVWVSPPETTVLPEPEAPLTETLPEMKVTPVTDGKLFEVHYNNKQIATVSLGSNELVYDGVNKNSFSSEKYKYAWFSAEEDSREMTIDETDKSYRLSTLLSNDDKEVSAIEFAFELPKDSDYLMVQMSTKTPDCTKLGEAGYMFLIPGYDVYLPDGQLLINDNETNYLDLTLTDNYQVLYNNEAAIIITASEITRVRNAFQHQVYKIYVREHLEGVFAPAYLLYVPGARVTFQDGELVIQTTDYEGTVKGYIELEIYENG